MTFNLHRPRMHKTQRCPDCAAAATLCDHSLSWPRQAGLAEAISSTMATQSWRPGSTLQACHASCRQCSKCCRVPAHHPFHTAPYPKLLVAPIAFERPRTPLSSDQPMVQGGEYSQHNWQQTAMRLLLVACPAGTATGQVKPSISVLHVSIHVC